VLTREQYQLLGIETASAELRQLSGAIRANGMLDVPPQNLVTISAPLGGFVKHTELLQGMKVKRGQVVVVLEHPDYRTTSTVKANLSFRSWNTSDNRNWLQKM
jgi:cobalt-zinc-cadmium efflux system membrane fusion protein